jgi:3-oxoacyl-[acyl-carrier-protein] synthase-3
MDKNAGIVSLAVGFPDQVRTNDYYREKYPQQVAAAEDKGTLARMFPKDEVARTDAFSVEMSRYFGDVFRGAQRRRVLAPGDTALTIETKAAREALHAAKIGAGDVELLMVSSFPADQKGVGNAVFLARELGTKRPAWNIESACTSSIAMLQTASALVTSGQYRNVLCTVSCTYSRISEESDSFAWFCGDGAASFLVSSVPGNQGLLGTHAIATTETADALYFADVTGADGKVRSLAQAAPGSGKVIRDTAEWHLRECCETAARKAGVRISDLDMFICGTQVAWLTAFAARVLGLDAAKTHNIYPEYANIGGALVPANLHSAARRGKIKKGDLVMIYNFGGVSTASASVLRWGDVQLGRGD